MSEDEDYRWSLFNTEPPPHIKKMQQSRFWRFMGWAFWIVVAILFIVQCDYPKSHAPVLNPNPPPRQVNTMDFCPPAPYVGAKGKWSYNPEGKLVWIWMARESRE